MSNQIRIVATLQTALAPLLWGTNYWIVTELLPPGRPLLAAAGRALPAGLLLVALTRRLPPAGWRLRVAVLASLNIGLFFVLLFISAERLPGGVAAAMGAVGPILVLLLGWPVLGLSPTWSGLAAGVVGVAGVSALVLGPAASLDAVGVAAATGAAASMAIATVLGRRWGRPPLPLLALTAWQLVLGGLLIVPFAIIFEGAPPLPTGRNLAGFAVMGLLGTALAHALWFRGVTVLPASAITFLALLSPVVATALGWAALGQSLSPLQLGGAALVAVAVVAGQRAARSPAPRSSVAFGWARRNVSAVSSPSGIGGRNVSERYSSTAATTCSCPPPKPTSVPVRPSSTIPRPPGVIGTAVSSRTSAQAANDSTSDTCPA